MDIGTLRAPFCSHWLTSQVGHLWNCLKQDRLALKANPYTVVLTPDLDLVEDKISASPATPHPAQILTQALDTPTVHHLVTVAAPSPNHSWQEVAIFNLMKLKCFMKLLETNQLKKRWYSKLLFRPFYKQYRRSCLGCLWVMATKIKLWQISLSSSTKLPN